MGRTPDRFPGSREDEEIILETNANAPAIDGGMRFDGTSFQFKDSTGIFDPRTGGSGLSPAQHENLDTLAHGIKETSYDDIEYFDPDKRKRVIRYTVWQTSAMLLRVRETLITYGADELKKKPVTVVSTQYDGAGASKESVTSTFIYSGKKLININRVFA